MRFVFLLFLFTLTSLSFGLPMGCSTPQTEATQETGVEPSSDGGVGIELVQPTDGKQVKICTDKRKKPSTLIDHSKWKIAVEKDDPFIGHKKPSHKCSEGAYKIEDGVIEIDTSVCNYITLEQFALTGLCKGEKLHIVLWHLQLFAPVPTKGHAAIAVDGKVIWEKHIPIPGKEEIYEPEWIPNVPIQKGSRISYHIHNHGTNTWKLLTLEAKP